MKKSETTKIFFALIAIVVLLGILLLMGGPGQYINEDSAGRIIGGEVQSLITKKIDGQRVIQGVQFRKGMKQVDFKYCNNDESTISQEGLEYVDLYSISTELIGGNEDTYFLEEPTESVEVYYRATFAGEGAYFHYTLCSNNAAPNS